MILTFVGVKMVMVDIYKIPVALSLGVIAGILTVAIIASLWHNRRAAQRSELPEVVQDSVTPAN